MKVSGIAETIYPPVNNLHKMPRQIKLELLHVEY
jgi:hypothetical protein